MSTNVCENCNHEINSTLEKCPYCGKDQRSWYLRNKVFIIFGLITFMVLLLFGRSIGSLLVYNNSSSSGSSATIGVGPIGEEMETEEFSLLTHSIEVVKEIDTTYFGIESTVEDKFIVVNWQYEVLTSERTQEPKPFIRLYVKTDNENEANIEDVFLEEINKKNREYISGEKYERISIFRVTEEMLDFYEWNFTISADWSITFHNN